MRPKQQGWSTKPEVEAEAKRIERREQSLDEALQETFPASDPPAALAPHHSHA